MDLVVIFQTSLYFAVAMSSVTLAVSEESVFPAIVTLPLAVISFWTVERWKRWGINGWKSNLLAVAAVGTLVFELQGPETYSRVIAGAHFLSYLTWIVLFQTKKIRQYWFLLALSWLQVAIAAVMTDSPLFGLTLFCYLLLAVWTLSLFALYQGVVDLVGERQLAAADGPRPQSTGSGWGSDWTTPPAIGSQRPASQTGSPDVRSTAATAGLLAAVNLPTRVRHAIQHDHRERWITARYASGIFLIAFGGFCVGLAFFLFTPRFWMGEFAAYGPRHDTSGLPLNRQTVTGFTGQVQLGDLGTILENSDPVFRLRLFRRQDEQRMSMDEFLSLYGLDAPVFRGNVLDTYDNGAWTAADSEDTFGVVSRNRSFATIRQEYTVLSAATPFLFTLSPFLAIRDGQTDAAQAAFPMRKTNSVVFRFRQRVRGPFEYWIYSPGEPIAPEDRDPAFGGLLPFPRLPDRIQQLYLAIPDRLVRLREMARSIGSSVPEAEAGEAGTVNAIVSRLRDSLEYSYSLDAGIQDASIDPVEDFLFNRKTGHCEYFATSLALLLRAEGIPSRMVTGYRGVIDLGELEYEVQQRHAHAWVEAWVDGQWLTLEATPPARDEEARSYGRDANPFANIANRLSDFWNVYIAGLNQDRQEEVFLRPIRDALESADSTGGRRGWTGFIKAVLQEFARNPAGLLSTTGVLFLIAAAAVVAGAIWLLGKLYGLMTFRGGRSSAAWQRQRIPVPFFDRFLEVCARRGWTPSPSQTAREFCHDVAGRMALFAMPPLLNPATASTGVTASGRGSEPLAIPPEQIRALADGPPLATEIGLLFETVRYGGAPVESHHVERLAQRLAAWDAACLVSSSPPSRTRKTN